MLTLNLVDRRHQRQVKEAKNQMRLFDLFLENSMDMMERYKTIASQEQYWLFPNRAHDVIAIKLNYIPGGGAPTEMTTWHYCVDKRADSGTLDPKMPKPHPDSCNCRKQIAIRNHALVERTVRHAQNSVVEFYVDNAKIFSSISKF
ncbi:4987_t:CDS:2 [Gigaspora rosea]|nr:4987_t:CDS:2 [Gigaspora rosea]